MKEVGVRKCRDKETKLKAEKKGQQGSTLEWREMGVKRQVKGHQIMSLTDYYFLPLIRTELFVISAQ